MMEVRNHLSPARSRRGCIARMQLESVEAVTLLLSTLTPPEIHLKPVLRVFISEALYRHFQVKPSANAKRQMASNGRGVPLLQEKPNTGSKG